MRLGGSIKGKDPTAALRARVDQPFRDGGDKRVVSAMRKSVDMEFAAAEWRKPGGGVSPWRKNQDFGDKKSGPRLGGRSGSINRAWQSGKVVKRRRSVSISAKVPHIDVHRGGAGLNASNKITRVRAKKRTASGDLSMRFALGFKGRWIRTETLLRGLEVHSSPHGTDNPWLRRQIEIAVVEGFK